MGLTSGTIPGDTCVSLGGFLGGEGKKGHDIGCFGAETLALESCSHRSSKSVHASLET
jgi:hypothetical protein